MVGAFSITETVSYGVLMYAFPVVLSAMQAELGWTQQTLTGAYSAASLVAGFASVPVGRWVDRHGARGVMTVSSIAASLLVVAWSRVQSPLGLYLIWLGLGGCMAGLFYEPAFTVIAKWFHSHRGRAVTVVTVAAGLASTIFVPLTAGLMARGGWRYAVLCLAGIIASLTIVPHALLLRRTPSDLGLVVDGVDPPERPRPADRGRPSSASPGDSPRSSSLRWLSGAFFLSTLANVAFAVHLIPLLLERGHPIAFASLALGTVGVMKLVGRVLIVPVAKRLTMAGATSATFLLQAVGLLALSTASGAVAVWLCVVLYGMGDGVSTPARAEIVAELYGAARYGTTAGVVAMVLAVARAVAPVGASLVYAATGRYDVLLWAMMGVLLIAARALRSAVARPTGGVASFSHAVRLLL